MQRNNCSNQLAGAGVAGSAEWRAMGRGMRGSGAEFRPWIFVCVFVLQKLSSGSLICLFSLALRWAQLECSERLAEIQTRIPGTG